MMTDDPPVVIDVRSPKEYSREHLPGAVNIPLSRIRAKMNDIPSTGRVALHCLSGYRSYVAQRMLMNLGWENVFNVQGGYQMIKLFSGMVMEGEAPEHTCLTPVTESAQA